MHSILFSTMLHCKKTILLATLLQFLLPAICRAENYTLLSASETNPIPMQSVAVDVDSAEHIDSRIAFRVRWTNPYLNVKETESHVVDCTFRTGGIRLGNETIESMLLNRFWGPADSKAADLLCGKGSPPNVAPEFPLPVIPLQYYSLDAQSGITMINALLLLARDRNPYALLDLRHAGEQGNTAAQLALARIYEDYRPIHNEVEAAKWYRMAAPSVIEQARLGDAAAQFELAQYHLKGIAVRMNRDEGVKWLQQAIAQNHAPAMTELAELYRIGPHKGYSPIPLDIAKGNEWLAKAARLGDGKAMFLLGQAYASGIGMDQDVEAAMSWRRQAAEAGYVNAQYFLGSAYLYGQGMPRDFALAEKWLNQAARQQSGQAQSLLGELYLNGKGVPQDDSEAFKWTKKATESGENVPEAFRHLEMMYREGRGTQQDIALADKLRARIEGQLSSHATPFGFPQPNSSVATPIAARAMALSQAKRAIAQQAAMLKEDRLALAERCSRVDDKFLDRFGPRQAEWEQQEVTSLAMMEQLVIAQSGAHGDAPANKGPFNIPSSDLSAALAMSKDAKGQTLPPLEPAALEKARQSAKAKAEEALRDKSIDAQKAYCQSQLIKSHRNPAAGIPQ